MAESELFTHTQSFTPKTEYGTYAFASDPQSNSEVISSENLIAHNSNNYMTPNSMTFAPHINTLHGVNQLSFPVQASPDASSGTTPFKYVQSDWHPYDGMTGVKTVHQRINDLFPAQPSHGQQKQAKKKSKKHYSRFSYVPNNAENYSKTMSQEAAVTIGDKMHVRHQEQSMTSQSPFILMRPGCGMHQGDCYHCGYCNCADAKGTTTSASRTMSRSHQVRSVSSHKVRSRIPSTENTRLQIQQPQQEHGDIGAAGPNVASYSMQNFNSLSPTAVTNNHRFSTGTLKESMPPGWLLKEGAKRKKEKVKTVYHQQVKSSMPISEEESFAHEVTTTNKVRSFEEVSNEGDFANLLTGDEDTSEVQSNYLTGEQLNTVVDLAKKALVVGKQDTQVAASLKRGLDMKLGRAWNVVTGLGPYGSHVASLPGALAHFRLYGWAFLIWQTPDE